MKKLLTATLLLSTLSFGANAISYTQTGGSSNTVSTSTTLTDNVLIRQGESVVKGSDVFKGGLDTTTPCDPINCSASDNTTTGSSVITTNTHLVINTTGSSTTNSTSASCFSGGSMAGLSHQESRSKESFATSGWSEVVATGTIVKTTVETATTTNPWGTEVGSVVNKVVDTTTINEATKTTFSTTGERITFSSSVGN
jgi:hypothetical protein